MEPLVLALAAGGTAQVISILVTALAALAWSTVGQAEAKSKEKINKTSPHLTPTHVHVVTVDPISKDPSACLKVEAGGRLSLS